MSSAVQMDAAIAAGLSADQMVALVAARHAWQVLGRLDVATISEGLYMALLHPAAAQWDAIFVRRALGELSEMRPTVGA